MEKARYIAIKDCDILQANGLSVSVWFAGCPFRCKGCHNPQTWDFKSGQIFDKLTVRKINSLLKNDKIRALAILGGEPLLERNFNVLKVLIAMAKVNNKEIWLWTGYTFEDIQHIDFIKDIDYIIDGQYIEEKKVVARYFGSSNQRLINVKEKLKR